MKLGPGGTSTKNIQANLAIKLLTHPVVSFISNSNNSNIPSSSLLRLRPLQLAFEGAARLVRGCPFGEREVDARAVLHSPVGHVEPHRVGKLRLGAELVERGKDVGRELHGRL